MLFIVATAGLIAAGGAHAILTIWDSWRPRFFTPNDDRVRPRVQGTGIRFRALFPGNPDRPSMWSAWLGFNVSHGMGLVAFGLVLLLLAASDFHKVTDTGGLMPVTVAISALYLATSLRFWFYAPTVLVAIATACFATAWALTLGV